MSVLIKGMEMPMVCRTCQFLLYINHYDELGVCGRTRKDVTQIRDKRDEDCPLIEIPPEHGDLIDRNKIAFDNWSVDGHVCANRQDILNMPVIVPREEDDDE
jgi:hypothetical protein